MQVVSSLTQRSARSLPALLSRVSSSTSSTLATTPLTSRSLSSSTVSRNVLTLRNPHLLRPRFQQRLASTALGAGVAAQFVNPLASSSSSTLPLLQLNLSPLISPDMALEGPEEDDDG
uniref:Uncharacterized protein n=1 Tax=Entomoneis paludosa TaxID=265537 RepID=A0A7S3DVZ3_9STRA|mmetsp:Transcript_4265/g.9179  ORF Transcript_4265/g.9179 Transcript_4265/m.9179 type:complete len:118 (+) Transcript_4265:126-479(+)